MFESRSSRRFVASSRPLVRVALVTSCLTLWSATQSFVHAQAQAQPQCIPDPLVGCFQSYDWNCQITDPGHSGSEFSVAALIPTGVHRGKVLMYRAQEAGTTVNVYIFDPASPQSLYRIDQTLATDLFCSSLTWSGDGTLLAAGGDIGQGNERAYRFIPGSLDFATPGSGCTPGTIASTPWTPPLGDMSISRYYPSLATAPREPTVVTAAGGPAIAGGFSMVLGGAPNTAGGASGVDDGNELWQMMPPRPALDWSRTFLPEGGVGSHPAPLAAIEVYYRRSLVPSNPASFPSWNFDSYPRAFFLANIVSGQTVFAHNLFVAGDTDTRTNFGPSIQGTEGASWVIRLPYAGGSTDVPELWRGQDAGSGQASNFDRNYASNVVMHMKLPNGTISSGKNRVLAFGGALDSTPPPAPQRSWSINQTVQEYLPGTNPVAADLGGAGQWISKTPPAGTNPVGRYFNNAVACPTGEILVIGGTEGITATNGGSSGPFKANPQLFYPGAAGQDALVTSSVMASPANVSGFNVPFQRLYHNWAMLLPDGRVINGGGAWATGGGTPDSRYSADIFSPPYLAYVTRPAIQSIELGGVDDEEFDFSTQSTTSTFVVTVRHAIDANRSIDQVVLLRPAAITHNHDADQRYIELEFALLPPVDGQPASHQRLEVAAPEDDLGPPGWYMLFVVEKNTSPPAGTPSRGPSAARFVRFF